MELAARLGTRADVVQSLEQGALYALPPWAETCRVVNAYGALLNLDVRPLLRRIYAQLEAGIVELQPKPMPDVPVMTPREPQDYPFAPANAGGAAAPNPLDIPWPPPAQQPPPQPQRNAWPNGPTAPSPQQAPWPNAQPQQPPQHGRPNPQNPQQPQGWPGSQSAPQAPRPNAQPQPHPQRQAQPQPQPPAPDAALSRAAPGSSPSAAAGPSAEAAPAGARSGTFARCRFRRRASPGDRRTGKAASSRRCPAQMGAGRAGDFDRGLRAVVCADPGAGSDRRPAASKAAPSTRTIRAAARPISCQVLLAASDASYLRPA